MNELKLAMENYFPKLLRLCKSNGSEYPCMAINENTNNVLLISQRVDDWYNWLPVEKKETTDFTVLEKNIFISFIKT